MIQNTKDKEIIQQAAVALLEEMKLSETVFPTKKYSLSPSAERNLREVIVNRLARTLEQSLLIFFLEYLNDHDVLDLYLEDPDNERLDSCRTEFLARITADGFSFLKAKVPHLYTRLFDTASQAVFVLREMLERIDACYEEIRDRLLGGKAFQCLTGISETGDLHNRSHAATVLTGDTGMFVYKPHNIRIDQLAHSLFETMFSDVLYSPAVVERDNFGFTEFIANEPCTTDGDAQRYFHNLGGLATAVQMLGSSDLHHNNVLARDGCPVIIDNELLITPGRIAEEPGLRRELVYSLLYSSLMPCRKGDTELSVLFAKDEANRSCPIINGVRKNVSDYPEEFLAGFRTIYLRCLEHREEIKTILRTWKNCPVRHMYRSTRDYMDLLEKTLEPGWIEEPKVKEELFRELSVAMKRSGSGHADLITEAECDAILRGDIPYVYTMTDSADLYAEGKNVFPGFFSGSPMDSVLSRIDYLSETDLAFETELLKMAMTRVITRRQRPAEEEPPVTGTRHLSEAELIEEAENLFRKIRDDMVETPEGKPLWFGPDYFMETGMQVLSSGFIDGITGLAVFFAAIAKLSRNPSVQKDARTLLGKIMDRVEDGVVYLDQFTVLYPNVENLSLTNGLAGKMLACRLIGNYTGDQRYTHLLQKILDNAKKADLQYEKPDIMNGFAGMLKVLCRYDDLFALEGAGEFAEQLALRLLGKATIPYRGKRLWRTLSPAWPISGAGHGQSGIAAALYLASDRLNRSDLKEAAGAGFEFETDIYSETLCAWPDRRRRERTEDYMSGWCSGAAGIGLDALRIPYEGHELNLRRAAESIRKQPLIFKDFLCCGNCAMIDFMIEAGRLYDPSLLDHAKDRMALMKERADHNGNYNYLSPSVTPLFSVSLFYGAAGIGYELLRMAAMDEIESLLL